MDSFCCSQAHLVEIIQPVAEPNSRHMTVTEDPSAVGINFKELNVVTGRDAFPGRSVFRPSPAANALQLQRFLPLFGSKGWARCHYESRGFRVWRVHISKDQRPPTSTLPISSSKLKLSKRFNKFP